MAPHPGQDGHNPCDLNCPHQPESKKRYTATIWTIQTSHPIASDVPMGVCLQVCLYTFLWADLVTSCDFPGLVGVLSPFTFHPAAVSCHPMIKVDLGFSAL